LKRGEVWWYERPDEKRRPVLLLTRSEAIEGLNRLVAVPGTTTIRGIRTEVELGPDDGMPRECVLSLDNTFSAHKGLLTERVTTLGAAKMDEVCKILDVATSC
jgi:mRNA interferase MazF